jgi:L-lysine 2,3-aminomutase
MKEKLEVGESRLLTKNDINLFVWKDKKKVIVLSNVYCGQIINKRRYDGIKRINIPKPFAIEEYNSRMIELTKTFHTINVTAKQYDTRSILLPYGSLPKKCAYPS